MSYAATFIAVFIEPAHHFRGNISAVIKLDKPISTDKMQEIAADLNQPATTFLWQHKNGYQVRWFAPDAEIGLCGHGTLAAIAYFDQPEPVELYYNDGQIKGYRNHDGTFSMMLDPIISKPAGKPDPAIVEALKARIIEYFSNDNKNIVLLENEECVRNLQPDFDILKNMDPFGIIITATGKNADFVSRTLVPKVQQLEDHATGSSHAALTPFWHKKLNKNNLIGHQLSPRGGKFICDYTNDKITLSGKAKVILKGQMAD